MANKFQIKRSAVPGNTPNTTSSSNSSFIDVGELAINVADEILYSSDGSSLITLSQQGFTGSQGDIGFTGSVGYTGSAGGSTGFTGSTGSSNVVPSNTAPTPSAGTIWFDTRTGKSYFYYNDGDSSQWILFADPTVTDGEKGYTGSKGDTGDTGFTRIARYTRIHWFRWWWRCFRHNINFSASRSQTMATFGGTKKKHS